MFVWHKIAIVSDTSGTTRDIVEFEYNDIKNDLCYILADSWWLDLTDKEDEISIDIVERTKKAIDSSDLLVWIVEYDRLTTLDEKVLEILRQKNFKNVVVVANKADNEWKVMEAYSLAWTWWFEHFFPVSVTHNKWINEVKDFIAKFLKDKWLNYKPLDEEEEWKFVKLAIVWRPNVWKSSLVNAITWKDAVMVKDLQWTTRDSVDTKFNHKGEDFILIDTAWIRRPWKIGSANIEDWSVLRTDRAIARADVVAVVIDWFAWIVHQDLAVINRALEEDKWLIIVINKWDKVLAKPWVDKERMMEKYFVYLKEKIEFLPWVSIVYSSALEWKRVDNILDIATEIKKERFKRVKTWVFNSFMEQVVYKHPPTWNKKSHSPKIYFWTQAETNPPKFIISINRESWFHFSYKRYLENKIRDNFWFNGTPILIEYKQKPWVWRYKKSKD